MAAVTFRGGAGGMLSLSLFLQIDSDSVPFRKGDPRRRLEGLNWGCEVFPHCMLSKTYNLAKIAVRRDCKQGPLPSLPDSKVFGVDCLDAI